MREGMEIIGYVLFGHDNGGYFFEGAPDGVLCGKCGTCLDYVYVPLKVKIPKSNRYDYSATYDNRPICSLRFINFLRNNLGFAVRSWRVGTNPDYFYIFPDSEIPFDPIATQTRFEKKCRRCGSYDSIVGVTPAHVKVGRLPGRGIFRTDLAFGSDKEKFPLILVDSQTKVDLLARKFRGMHFEDVYSSLKSSA